MFVQKKKYEEFLAALVPIAEKLKAGDPLNEATDIGPMIRESDAIRVEEWLDEAQNGGATVLCGGHRKGTVVEATVLTHTNPKMKVNCLEVFAPVVTVEPYDEFDEALEWINDSLFGLQAGVFTKDATLIMKAFERIEVGGLVAGDVPTFRMDNMPYGGVKESGLGREGVRYAIEEMTERKILVWAV